MDDNLEALRKKRLQEFQQQQASSQEDILENQETQQKELEAQRQMILRAILTHEARERLGRLKIARPKITENIENQLIMLAQDGRLQTKINDEQLRSLLARIMPKKKEIKIRRR
jgi:programmed cell death protein 5